MRYKIRGKNITITPGIEDAIKEKLSKVERYFKEHDEFEANVLVRVYNVGQKIEVTIPIRNHILRAESQNKDLYAAMDLVVDKLEDQIRRYKTKLNNKHRVKTFVDDVVDEVQDDAAAVVARVKNIQTKPMSDDEAIMQMELLGHTFFVYSDEETDATKIVYARENGGFGILIVN